jgi:hypothetical protein
LIIFNENSEACYEQEYPEAEMILMNANASNFYVRRQQMDKPKISMSYWKRVYYGTDKSMMFNRMFTSNMKIRETVFFQHLRYR